MNCPTCNQEFAADVMTFGGRLRESRILKEITAKELGVAIGHKSSSQVTRWESGTSPMPDSVTALTALAEALDVDVMYLMMGMTPATTIAGQTQLDVDGGGVPGAVDRAGRIMVDEDGYEIPIDDRVFPGDVPDGVPYKKG
jgi:hypothetical protein